MKRLRDIKNKRAKAKGIEFNLSYEDLLPIPTKCPLLGIPIFYEQNKRSDHSPSIDRIDSNKGYTKDNVWIISNKANRIKSDATISDLFQILAGILKVEDIVRHSSENWRDKIKSLSITDDAVRALFPEILLGVYTDSEIVDALNTEHETTINEEGEVVIIDTPHEEVK